MINHRHVVRKVSGDQPQTRGIVADDQPQTCGKVAGDQPQTHGRVASDQPQTCGIVAGDQPQTRGRVAVDQPQKYAIVTGDQPQTCGIGARAQPQTCGRCSTLGKSTYCTVYSTLDLNSRVPNVVQCISGELLTNIKENNLVSFFHGTTHEL